MKHITLQKIVAHDFRYDPRNTDYFFVGICPLVCMLFGRQLFYFFFIHMKETALLIVCGTAFQSKGNVTMAPTALFISHYPKDLGYTMQYFYTVR